MLNYKCECGKEFQHPNEFNSHKSNCKIHFEAVGKDFNLAQQNRINSAKKAKEIQLLKLEIKKQQKLEQWISEKHKCETCGKVMTEKYGSGRFCCRSCANTRKTTLEQRYKLSKKLNDNTTKEIFIKKCTEKDEKKNRLKQFQCSFCGKTFINNQSLLSHITKTHVKKDNQLYRIGGVELDVTYDYIQQYRLLHTQCEICGKTVEESTKYEGKGRVTQLSIDHNHLTNQFRGLLCQQCNRQLGFFEKYKEEIILYLDKKNM